MLEESITLVKSKGEMCFICDQTLGVGDVAIKVVFDVPMLVTTAKVSKIADLGCAIQMSELIRRRIREASAKAPQKGV